MGRLELQLDIVLAWLGWLTTAILGASTLIQRIRNQAKLNKLDEREVKVSETQGKRPVRKRWSAGNEGQSVRKKGNC